MSGARQKYVHEPKGSNKMIRECNKINKARAKERVKKEKAVAKAKAKVAKADAKAKAKAKPKAKAVVKSPTQELFDRLNKLESNMEKSISK